MGVPPSCSNIPDSEVGPAERTFERLKNKRCRPPKIIPDDRLPLDPNTTISIEMRDSLTRLQDDGIFPLNARNTDIL